MNAIRANTHDHGLFRRRLFAGRLRDRERLEYIHSDNPLQYALPESNREPGHPLWFTCLLIVVGVPSVWILFIAARVAWF